MNENRRKMEIRRDDKIISLAIKDIRDLSRRKCRKATGFGPGQVFPGAG